VPVKPDTSARALDGKRSSIIQCARSVTAAVAPAAEPEMRGLLWLFACFTTGIRAWISRRVKSKTTHNAQPLGAATDNAQPLGAATDNAQPLGAAPAGYTARTRQQPGPHARHAGMHACTPHHTQAATHRWRGRLLSATASHHTCLSKCPVPLRAKIDYPVPTATALPPHTHKRVRGVTPGAAASARPPRHLPPRLPVKVSPCCKGNGRPIQFQTTNRSAIASSPLSKS
jgi:hypothetical protein